MEVGRQRGENDTHSQGKAKRDIEHEGNEEGRRREIR